MNSSELIQTKFKSPALSKSRKARQLSFNSHKVFKDFASRLEHGHGVRQGKRKLSRPFDSKKSMHITLRSAKARGKWSFLHRRNDKKIQRALYRYAVQFNIKIYRFANVGNHLHILLKGQSKREFQSFLRTFSGVVPRVVMNAKKGKPGEGVHRGKRKFWDGLTYSKLIVWGKQFQNTSQYVLKNTLEAFGILPPRREARGHSKLDYEGIYREALGSS